MLRKIPIALAIVGWASVGSQTARSAVCEDVVGQHMVAEALLAANLVAISERAGVPPSGINAILKSVSERSVIEEFWITDSSGHAYLTNTGIDFSFNPDSSRQPQAAAFWPLLENKEKIVIREARKREIDDRVFKYVGVSGVDKPRIVQVGVSGKNLTCN